jgi:hypothetical protein
LQENAYDKVELGVESALCCSQNEIAVDIVRKRDGAENAEDDPVNCVISFIVMEIV